MLQRMDHVGMIVDDLKAAPALFVELGLELEGETTVEGQWVDRCIGLDGVRSDIAMLKTPDGHGRVELSRFHTPPATTAEPNAPVNTLGIRRPPPRRRHTLYTDCMTMLSFRVAEEDAERVQAWAERLGVDRSELLREAVRLHLLRLASENDAATWVEHPLEPSEQTLEAIAEWGPAEDWSDWADAAR